MMQELRIGSRRVGHAHPTFIIAELGINHNGDVKLGKELIAAAAEAGCDAVKFQTYITEQRFSPENPFVKVFKECELTEEQEAELWDYARSRDEGLAVLSTPFDPKSVELCEKLNADGLKVASFETTNRILLRAVAATGRPTLISCGQNSQEEIEDVVNTMSEYACPHALLHCISSYPMDEEDANLAVISAMRRTFKCPIGFSDHSLGHHVGGYAVAAGACIIEKHFTIDKSLDGPDHATSATPDEMAALVQHVRDVEVLVGSPALERRDCEIFIYENCRRVTD